MVCMYLPSTNETIILGHRIGRLYYLDLRRGGKLVHRATAIAHRRSQRRSYREWHSTLRHASENITKTLEASEIPYDFRPDPFEPCGISMITKFRRLPVRPPVNPPFRPLHTIREDSFQTPGETYYWHRHCVFLICTFTPYVWVEWTQVKSNIPRLVIQKLREVESEYKYQIAVLASDQGVDCNEIRDFILSYTQPDSIKTVSCSHAGTQWWRGTPYWYLS